jgi:hypothetical protein
MTMSTCRNNVVFSSVCAAIIAALSSFSTVSMIIQFPRASALLCLSKWANLYLQISALPLLHPRTSVLLAFALSILNLFASRHASFVSNYFLLDAILSLTQILHILMLPLSALHFINKCATAYAHQVLVAMDKPKVVTLVRFLVFTKMCSVASAVSLAGLPTLTSTDGISHYPLFLQ